jgi:hypothetical protein
MTSTFTGLPLATAVSIVVVLAWLPRMPTMASWSAGSSEW